MARSFVDETPLQLAIPKEEITSREGELLLARNAVGFTQNGGFTDK
jgi:hypothetical protein